MRTVVLIAVSLLAAGCSGASVEPSPTTTAEASAPPRASAPARSTPTPAVPGAGASIVDVISWIEAGRAVDAAGYRSATRDGESTELGDDIAFTSGGTVCMTDSRHTGGALACLVDLADPPPPPTEVYGQWKGNWVDFTGDRVQVGSVHADPGPFHLGSGQLLADGTVLSFGDYRCRADRTGLFCVNYAHRAAVRLSPAGVEPFGCLKSAPKPAEGGELFSC